MNLMRFRKLRYALPLVALVTACTAGAATAKPTAATPIKIGILSDCKGEFAAFHGADVGGAIMAFVQLTGAKVVNKNDPIKGGTISGHPVKLVGRLFRCIARPRHQGDQAPDGEVGSRHHDRPSIG